MLVYKENPFLALVPKDESPTQNRQGLLSVPPAAGRIRRQVWIYVPPISNYR